MSKLVSSIVFVVVLCTFLVVSGCRSNTEGAVDNSANEVKEMAVPYSRGPSGPPSVKGPSSGPPVDGLTDDTPQAVTEVEDVRITLPEN